MTDATNDILEHYQVRKTKKQKSLFIKYIYDLSQTLGYHCHWETGALGARNIVVGYPHEASVIYTAHYDTCAHLPIPNFITPKNFAFYILYQIFLTLILFLPVLGAMCLVMRVLVKQQIEGPAATLILFGSGLALFGTVICLLMAGPANKHTANDNTSGVTTILEIMQALPKEDRHRVAFILFDLEEVGLLGSIGYVLKHRKFMSERLLINFDCVSDGNHMLLSMKTNAADYISVLEKAFPTTESITSEIAMKNVYYPSDHINFTCGVGIASFKQSKLPE